MTATTPFEVSLQAVSKHLGVRNGSGLISRGRRAQWRPCRLEAAPLESASARIDRYRKVWTDRFDRREQASGMQDGGGETLDRLAELVASLR